MHFGDEMPGTHESKSLDSELSRRLDIGCLIVHKQDFRWLRLYSPKDMEKYPGIRLERADFMGEHESIEIFQKAEIAGHEIEMQFVGV